mgnify:CR=1 FL=1
MIKLLVNADNAIDMAHAERCPLPFLSSMIDDCMKSGKSVQEGGAVYNFTGPQGFGIANMADSLYVVKTLVYDEKKIVNERTERSFDNKLWSWFESGRHCSDDIRGCTGYGSSRTAGRTDRDCSNFAECSGQRLNLRKQRQMENASLR